MLIATTDVLALDDHTFDIPQSSTDPGEAFNQLSEGEATITSDDPDSSSNTEQVDIDMSESQDDTLANSLTDLGTILPDTINLVLSAIVTNQVGNPFNGVQPSEYFTIGNLLTNKYPLFDINMLEDTPTGPNSDFSNKLKDNVAVWFVAIRNISVVGCFVVLLYVGIRMAIASNSIDSAKYKKMLMNWLIGIILLFILPYLTLLMIKISNLFVEFISKSVSNNNITTDIETSMLTGLAKDTADGDLWTQLVYLVLLCVLVFYEIKFFVMYLFRVLKVFILTIISPLICLTYPIDAIGDGKAQAFNNWTKSMMSLIFIQPIHLVIYVVFMYSAGAIVTTFPVLGIVFIVFLDNAEKIVKSALKIRGEKVNKKIKEIKIRKEKKKKKKKKYCFS